MGEEHRTLRYMTRFRCIGAECEDSCCENWHILLDKSSYKRIRRALNGSPGERKRFGDSVDRCHQAADRKSFYAELKLKPDGSCRFLTSEKQCHLHAHYGESVLPNICASYPRVTQLVGERVELSGRLSCPEVARLCLLAEDGVEIDRLEPEVLEGRRLHARPIELNPRAPYHQSFDAVRELAIMLLEARSYPLSSRLFFIGSLALRVDRHFHECTDVSAMELLGKEIERLCDPRTLERLHVQLLAASTADHRTTHIVGRSLMDLLQAVKHPGFRRVTTQAFASYAGVAPERIDADSMPESSMSVREAESAYLQRNRRYSELGQRIERYFENYARNYFMTEAYVNSPSLLCHLEKLLMRMAILRVLLMGHPRLHRAFEESIRSDVPAGDACLETLDAAAVETFYSFCRGIEHDPHCVASMQGAWEDVQNPERLYRLLEFIGGLDAEVDQ